MKYHTNNSKFRYSGIKGMNTLFCITLPVLLILSFFFESEASFQIGLAFIIILHFMSFIIIRRKIDTLRYLSIMIEFIVLTLISLNLILNFDFDILFGSFFFILIIMENLVNLFDKNIFTFFVTAY